jgi:hypothetical protein
MQWLVRDQTRAYLVGVFLPRALLLGVNAKKAFIKPQLGTLSSSEITVPSIKGLIKASYRRKSRTLQEYTFEMPANVSAELELKYSPEDTILLNGMKADTSFGTLRLSPGINTVVLNDNTF